jgi:hypothetical protein
VDDSAVGDARRRHNPVGKPAPIRYQSDECPLQVEGVTYYPHEGEWVELIPVGKVGELQLILRYQQSLKDKAEDADLIDRMFEEVWRTLVERVVDWNWTDLQGRQLPKPKDDPEVLKRLSSHEMFWLSRLCRTGETEEMRKNDGEASPKTSSAKALTRTKSS